MPTARGFLSASERNTRAKKARLIGERNGSSASVFSSIVNTTTASVCGRGCEKYASCRSSSHADPCRSTGRCRVPTHASAAAITPRTAPASND